MSHPSTTTDLLIIGGGTAGTAAAIQAASMGVRVLVAEESVWLGGMITAAGVSAFDGNKFAMGSGLFHRLRRDLEKHYGGAEQVFTGWISHTCFEPKVGRDLLHGYVKEAGAEVWFQASLLEVLRENGRVIGARFAHEGQVKEVRATITIEATEYGDVLDLGKVPYRLGRDSKEELGEEHAPDLHDMEIQDMTWCATLKRVPGGADPISQPAGYDPAHFDGAVAEYATTRDEEILNHKLHPFESFLSYSLLPEDKYLLNWPHHANDSPDTHGIFGTPEQRLEAFRRAKHRTLCFVYFMQTQLAHPEWGLATDEYPTPDHLALIPYVRESRRVIAVRTMVEKDVLAPDGHLRAPFQPTSIAIGDYFLDHHHSKMHLPPGERLEENYPDNAPFQIPYESLVPEAVDGLLVTEKSLGVSHIVNGCTRLQPVVMLTGQATGAAAAMCIQQGIEPRQLDVRRLQHDVLIPAGVALYQTLDVFNDDPQFAAVQHLALRGFRPEPDALELKLDEALTLEQADAYTKAAAALGPDLADAIKPGMKKREVYAGLWERMNDEG